MSLDAHITVWASSFMPIRAQTELTMKKYSRTNVVSEEEEIALQSVCNTRGFTRYGNKARVTANLDTDLSVALALIIQDMGISVGELINKMVRAPFSAVSGCVRYDMYGNPIVDQQALILNLSIEYGGFYTVSDSISCRSVKPSEIDQNGEPVALIRDTYMKLLSMYDKRQLVSYTTDGGVWSISFEDNAIRSGWIVLKRPIDPFLHRFLQSVTFVAQS